MEKPTTLKNNWANLKRIVELFIEFLQLLSAMRFNLVTIETLSVLERDATPRA